MHFPSAYISVFLCAAFSFLAGTAESDVDREEFNARIKKQRTVSCPLNLDTTGMQLEKEREAYYCEQVLSELPYSHMDNVIKYHTDIVANQVLNSTGGYFAVNDDRNSISQIYCSYKDVSNRSVHLAFAFEPELKLHISDRVPAAPDEVIFTKPGRVNCSALNELSTPDSPSCRATMASLLITNQINVVTVDGYPQNRNLFGYLSYKSSTTIPEFTGESDSSDDKKRLIKPGETGFYPISQDLTGHGVLWASGYMKM